MRVRDVSSAADSPAGDLPTQLLRDAPLPAPLFEGDGLDLEVGLDTIGSPRGPARLLGFIGSHQVTAPTGLVPRPGWRQPAGLHGLRRGPAPARAGVAATR